MTGSSSPVLVQYWHQDAVPAVILHRQASWDAHLPGRVRRFDQRSALEFLTEHFDQSAVDSFLDCGVPAMASDFFRYHYLAVDGGAYVDSAFELRNPAKFDRLLQHPLLIAAVPSADLTPEIALAREELGRVLLNGVLLAHAASAGYFRLLAALVRRLVAARASESIPYLTGIGVLTLHDYAVRSSNSSGSIDWDPIDRLLSAGDARVREVTMTFFLEHESQLAAQLPCGSLDFRELADTFARSEADDTRLRDAAHWSNHEGSVFSA